MVDFSRYPRESFIIYLLEVLVAVDFSFQHKKVRPCCFPIRPLSIQLRSWTGIGHKDRLTDLVRAILLLCEEDAS